MYEYRACGTIESFLLLFYANLGPNNGAFEKRALPVALEAYKLASDPRALRKKIVNA